MSTAAHRRASSVAGVLVLGNVLATLAEIAIPLLVVRLLGKAEVGGLMVLFLVYNTLAPIVSLGVPQTVMYNLPGRPLDERAAIARRILGVMLGLGGVAAAVLVGVGLLGEATLAALSLRGGEVDLSPLLLLALFPLGDIPARMLTNLLVAEDRPRAAAGYGMLRSLGMSVCTLVPLSVGGDAWGVAGSLGGLAMVQLGLVLVHFRRLYGGAARRRSPVSTRAILSFGLPIGMTTVVSVLNKFFDRFVVLLAFGGVMYAEYEAGAWQIPIVSTIPYVIGTAMAPQMVASFRAGQPLDALRLWGASIKKVSLLVVPVTLAFMVATEEAVELLFTAQYAASVPVLRWYTLLAMGRVAAFGEVIVAAGRPQYVLQAALLSFGSNVVLSLLLLEWLGFVGPAMGTALAFIPMAVFYCWCIARAAGVRLRQVFPLRAYLQVVAVGLVGVAAGLVVKTQLVAGTVAMLAAQMGAVVVTFAVVGTAVGVIGREDWRYLGRWVRLRMLDR
jgi:O-antigen/teichoic acid export membrane protein